jgi:hypothetical protein
MTKIQNSYKIPAGVLTLLGMVRGGNDSGDVGMTVKSFVVLSCSFDF